MEGMSLSVREDTRPRDCICAERNISGLATISVLPLHALPASTENIE